MRSKAPNSAGANGFYAIRFALRRRVHGRFPWPWLSFWSLGHTSYALQIMKLDLDSLSKRYCSAGMLALLAEQFFPNDMPVWLGWFSVVAIITGLCFMLAHQIVSRRQAERAAKM